jgi:hypothetical protein
VFGDDEMMDNNGTNREEAPCDDDVVMPCIVTLDVGTPSVIMRPRRHSRASQ